MDCAVSARAHVAARLLTAWCQQSGAEANSREREARIVDGVKTAQEALKFVRRHGVVLEAGRGPVANLAEAIAGGPIRGSWWGHPKGKLIFRLTRDVRDKAEILVCRLIAGKITFVHRRLWPALVRLADSFDRDRLAALHEVHTASGAHKIIVTPYPQWVPAAIRSRAARLSAEEAARQLGTWVSTNRS